MSQSLMFQTPYDQVTPAAQSALKEGTHRVEITDHSHTLLEKLTGTQLVKFPAIYGTRRLITAFTSARHLSL